MQLDWRHGFALEPDEVEWLRVVAEGSSTKPFGDPDVLIAWAASTPPDQEVVMGRVRDDDGLVGLLVMHREPGVDGRPWRLWGDLVDLGVIWCRPGTERACWRAWLSELDMVAPSVFLRNLRLVDPVSAALVAEAVAPVASLTLRDRRGAPHVDLRDGYDGWLSRRTSSQRRQYRRSAALFASIPDLTIEQWRGGEPADRVVGEMLGLHRARCDATGRSSTFGAVGDDGDTDPAASFLVDMVSGLARRDRAQVIVARSAGRAVAAEIVLTDTEVWSSYNGGWDAAFARHHPGTGIILEAMRLAAAAGARRYGLLDGEEPYKVRMADGAVQLTSWSLAVPGVESARSVS